MEPLDDSHYLEPPDEERWCEYHNCHEPCEGCQYEETD